MYVAGIDLSRFLSVVRVLVLIKFLKIGCTVIGKNIDTHNCSKICILHGTQKQNEQYKYTKKKK